ncbi:MAG: agmatinase [Rhodobacteraceae bacterium]|nr:MAG: agmatinase [Paracoccaceae bacterium]
MSFRKDYAVTADGPRAVTHDEYMYAGALSFCRRLYARSLVGVDVAVMGVPFDTAVTNRPGCRFGPRAIRAASSNLAWSRAWPSAFDPFERLAVVDWGDVQVDHGFPAQVPEKIEAAVRAVHEAGAATLLLGGDHFISYPSLRAHAETHGAPLALVQFDAHTDTWADEDGRIDHGTMFYRAVKEGLIDPARSIQVGIRTTNDDPMGVEIFDAIKVHEEGWKAAAAAIRARVGDAPCYVTFDIDGLDPSVAPGTGTPVCGGLFMHQALAILRAMQGMTVVGMDVVEVAPAYDVAEITALAGATVALELLCLYASRPA